MVYPLRSRCLQVMDPSTTGFELTDSNARRSVDCVSFVSLLVVVPVLLSANEADLFFSALIWCARGRTLD